MRFQSRTSAHHAYDETKQAVKILRAAKVVFIRDGGAKFSARRVAKEVKLSLGSVQHFFPTTDALMTAMLEYVVNGYDAAYQAMAAKLPFNSEARLRSALDYLLEDIFSLDTRRFFFGLWALSCHNKLAGTLMDEAYTYHRLNLATFIGAARPTFSEERCRDLATHVAALVEGLMLFTAPRGKPLAKHSSLIRSVKRTIWTIISVDPVEPL